MINGWQFALLALAYFVLLVCALSFANTVPDEDQLTAPAPLDELASRRIRPGRGVSDEAVRTVHAYGSSRSAG